MTPIETANTYSFSFMAVSLRPELTRVAAEIYLEELDWDSAKSRVLGTNALQCRSARTAVRMERELRQRLRTLTNDQLALLATATADDGAALSWLAAIKHIRFAFDFAAEVLRDKIAAHDPILRYSDYETYIETKSVSHPELGPLSASSRIKVRQILLSMLVEAGLTGAWSGSAHIRRPLLSPEVLATILSDNPRWLAGFLVPDEEIGGMRCPHS